MIYIILLSILGAAVGSFLNVCIHRLPRGESIVFPPSHCPDCGKGIPPIDLIPILGYFLLQGKCRACRAPISFRYPLVEILSAAAFPLIWMSSGANVPDFIFQIIFVVTLTLIFFIDIEQQVVPDSVSAAGMVAGLLYNLLHGKLSLPGIIIGFGSLYLIGRLGKWIFKKESVGEGDFLIGALLGAYLGGQAVLLAIFLAYFLAALVILPFLMLSKVKMGQIIPFGPALAGGGIIAFFWGKAILAWYGALFL